MNLKHNVNFLVTIFILNAFASLASGQVYRAEPEDGLLKISTWHRTHPIEINWKSLVPQKYSSIEIGPIPKELREEFEGKRDLYSNAEFTFQFPLTENLSNKHFYLISENGVNKINIQNVEAVVRFKLKRNASHIYSVSYFGYLILSQKWTTYPGFVIISDDKKKYEIAHLAIDLDAIQEDDHVGRIQSSSPEFQISKSFTITDIEKDTTFSFVSFLKGKDNQCSFRAVVVTSGNNPKIIGWNYSGCDI